MLLKNELIGYCHRVYQNQYVAATDGNLSVRQPDGTYLVTASGICKGDITPEDIIHTDKQGNPLFQRRKVSTEFKMHLQAYKMRPDVNAVVHCHPVYVTAFASSGKSLDRPVFPEIILTLGRIPLCPYATPSTEDLALSFGRLIENHNAVLLENHGAVTVGRNIKEAYYRMEKLEHTAKILFAAEFLGGARNLAKEKIAELYDLAPKVYGLDINSKNKF